MGITTASVPHVGGCDVSVIRQNVIVVVYSLGPVRLFATPWTVAHQVLQARVLEWVAISFSRGSSLPKDGTQVSRIAGRCFNL